jgi:anti-anti-sigma factor
MTINKQQNGGSLVIKLEGRLDTMTAPALEKEVKGSLDGVTELTFDFEKLDYVSSAGLRILLSAYKAMLGRGTMRIVNFNDIIREVFNVTGFADVLQID